MTTIYELDDADRHLLSRYSAVDGCSGEAFADDLATVLVDDWREIAAAELARHENK